MSDRWIVFQIAIVRFRRYLYPIRIDQLVRDALHFVSAHPYEIMGEVQNDFPPKRHYDRRLHRHGIADVLGVVLGRHERCGRDNDLHFAHVIIRFCK